VELRALGIPFAHESTSSADIMKQLCTDDVSKALPVSHSPTNRNWLICTHFSDNYSIALVLTMLACRSTEWKIHRSRLRSKEKKMVMGTLVPPSDKAFLR
jgi:hypothetical protein